MLAALRHHRRSLLSGTGPVARTPVTGVITAAESRKFHDPAAAVPWTLPLSAVAVPAWARPGCRDLSHGAFWPSGGSGPSAARTVVTIQARISASSRQAS